MRLGKFEKRWSTLFSNQFIAECHLYSWKIILSCYVAVHLQVKDFRSANLTFRVHNLQN